MRYDRDAHQFVPYLNGMSAEGLDFSKDGQSMVYVSYPDGALWRSRLDGSQRVRLSPAGMWASLPRWSPDGKRIVFTGSKPGKRMKAYTVLAEGGNPEPMIEGDGPEFDAAWSPDGKSLVFAESYQAPVPALHLLDFESRRTTTIEKSQGLFSPRWSPGGDYIAALTVNSFNLQVFDMRLRRWRALVLGRHASYPCWSTDGKYLYFLSVLTATTDFYRVRVDDGLLELVAKVQVPKGLAAGFSGRWTGLGPGDTPLLLRDTSIQEIFALKVKWR
jgi:Tol biopolymer transport system component